MYAQVSHTSTEGNIVVSVNAADPAKLSIVVGPYIYVSLTRAEARILIREIKKAMSPSYREEFYG